MSKRIQREIEDILGQLDDLPDRPSLIVRLSKTVTSQVHGLADLLGHLPKPSVGKLMLAGTALIVAGWVADPGSTAVYWSLMGIGASLLGLGVLLSFRRTARPIEKRWRGQPLDLDQGQEGHGRSLWRHRRRR